MENVGDIIKKHRLNKRITQEEILGGTVNEVKRGRKWNITLCILTVICVVVSLFVGLGGMDYIRHRSRYGVMLLTVYEDGALLSSEDYFLCGDEEVTKSDKGYIFDISYGKVKGILETNSQKEIEFGFVNTNNWHNVHMCIEIENENETVYVKQIVTYQTDGVDGKEIEVIISEEKTKIGEKISVYREGV